MIEGKIPYDSITIPDNLSDILTNTQKRFEKEKRKRSIKTIGMAAAACLTIFVTSNIPSVYASLSNMPVVGSLVKALNIGTGGEITDGLFVNSATEADRLKIWFQQEGSVTDFTPFYTIKHRKAPDRIDITLQGVRGFEMDAFLEQAKSIPYVKDAYQIVILDDSAFQVGIELREGVIYEASEFKDPGYLEISFQQGEIPASSEIFFVRSNSMEMGEPLAQTAEAFLSEDSSIAQAADGSFMVVIGEYNTKEEAEEKQKALSDQFPETEFWVDSCGQFENPSK